MIQTIQELSSKSEALIEKENKYGAHNYHPLPVVLEKGEGVFLWDVDGKRYYDFLSGYSAVNQGHCHPKIIPALKDQAEKVTLTSRAFYNSELGAYEKFITEYFGYEKVLPMNTGVEGGETAVKLARKWGKLNKNAAGENRFEIITFDHSFHGRTLATMSASGKPGWDTMFAPQVPGFCKADLNDLESVKKLVTDKTVAVMIEPIQGEGGVIPASREFMQGLRALTSE